MAAIVDKQQIIDKEELKVAFLELLKTDKAFANEISAFFQSNNTKNEPIDIDDEDSEFDALVRKNFDRYEKTFKALA